MASKNIRDVTVKVSGKDIKNAAADSAKLNENLKQVIETVKGSGRSFTSINNALEKLGDSMKTVNSAMSANKVKTKGLETYQARMKELNKTLVTVKNNAQNTAKAMQSVNKSVSMAGATDEMKDLKDGIQKLVEEMRALNFTSKRMKDELVGIEENTGKTSKRLKETREATKGTANAMDEFNRSSKKATQGADEFNNALRGLNGGGRNGARSFSELAFSMNPLTSLYATIAVNVYALAEAYRLLNEAANLERLVANLESFSAAVGGLNVSALAEDMSKLSGSILSVEESLRFATKGAAFNFTAEQLERLTVGARKASIALGLNFNDAMDRTLRGISKQEIELFDELGVVTRLTPAFEKYAASVSKTVDELTDYERQLALTNEVQRQFDTRFSGITISATPWEELGKAVKDATSEFLIFAQNGLTPVANGLTDLINTVRQYTDGIVAQDKAMGSLETSLDALRNGSDYAGEALTAYTEYLKLSNEETEKLSKKTSLIPQKFQGVAVILGTLVGALGGATVGAALLSKSIAGLATVANAATAALTRMWVAASRHPALLALGLAAGAVAGAMVTMNATMDSATEKTQEYIEKQKTAAKAAVDTAKIQAALAAEGIDLTSLRSGDAFQKYVTQKQAEAQKQFLETSRALSQQVNLGLISASEEQRALAELQKDAEKSLNIDTLFREFLSVKVAGPVKAAKADLTSLTQTAEATINSMSQKSTVVSELLKSVNSLTNLEAEITQGLAHSKGNVDLLAESLKALREKTGASFGTAAEFRDMLLSVEEQTESLGNTMDRVDLLNKYSGANKSEKLSSQLAIQEQYIETLKKAPKLFSAEIEELKRKIALMKQEISLENTKLATLEAIAAVEYKSQLITAKIGNDYELTQMPIRRQLKDLETKYELEKANKNLSSEALERLKLEYDREKAILDIMLERAKVHDTLNRKAQSSSRDYNEVSNAFSANNMFASLGGREVSKETKAGQTSTLLALEKARMQAELDRDRASMSTPDIKSAESAISLKDSELRVAIIKQEAAAYRDMADAIGSVADMVPGLTSLQSEFLGMSQTMANTIGNVTELLANNQELTLSDFSDSIISMGTFAADMFSELTQGVVSDIDAQIAAEKKRDGKSEESLAKIRQLERKKIKEQEKSKIAQTAMSTSLAIMQTMAEPLPFPVKLAMSAAIGAMGMMQIGNIKKASAGQIAGLDEGGAGGLSVSVGSRNNAVDVSQSASMGELAFLRGESGTGSNANSFAPGRAGGGSITVGERGPEQITPLQPLYVEPTSSESSKGSGGLSIDVGGLSITTMDSESFQEMAGRNASAFWDAVEAEANARGVSLNSLN